VLVTGEVSAAVLYIREGQAGLAVLRVRKPFSIEFETDEAEGEAQVGLFIQGTDVRMVNPRKISAAFEIEASLAICRSDSIKTETAAEDEGIFTLSETETLALPNAMTEKSFAVNEQFAFPADQPKPEKLLTERAELLVTDCQTIGSKLILKGTAEFSVCYLPADSAEPVQTRFSAPFSQIVDVGTDGVCDMVRRVEFTGAYFDLIDGINGEKLLDAEVHAVAQLLCSGLVTVQRITDAYSNRMPVELMTETLSCPGFRPMQTFSFSGAEQVALNEDCGELLCVFPTLSRITREEGRLGTAVNLDLLYRSREGVLNAVRRTVSVGGDTGGGELRLLSARVVKLDTRAEGQTVDCRVEVAFTCCAVEQMERSVVTGLVLDEEAAYRDGDFPTLTLARSDGESLWSLAKRYHSSEQLIRVWNAEPDSGRMLLIPKCM